MSPVSPAAGVAALFPGQGSQEPGMGRDVAENWPEAMELWKKAEAAAQAPLREMFWDGDAETMAQTRYLQPALTVTNLTLWAYVHRRCQVGCAAGHSLGEFAALAAAGVLSAADVLDLVAVRGRLMAEAGQGQNGAMAAVLKLEQSQVEALVEQVAQESAAELRIANYNAPNQLVVSGHKAAVERLGHLAKNEKGRAVPLPVSGAFHSPLMHEAADELRAYMQRLAWQDAKFPVYLNVTGQAEQDGETIKALMGRQMLSSVLWSQTIAAQWEDGVRFWIEVGPKQVLKKLLTANLKGASQNWDALAVGKLADVETVEASSLEP